MSDIKALLASLRCPLVGKQISETESPTDGIHNLVAKLKVEFS
jgi:hypothetical protein